MRVDGSIVCLGWNGMEGRSTSPEGEFALVSAGREQHLRFESGLLCCLLKGRWLWPRHAAVGHIPHALVGRLGAPVGREVFRSASRVYIHSHLCFNHTTSFQIHHSDQGIQLLICTAGHVGQARRIQAYCKIELR